MKIKVINHSQQSNDCRKNVYKVNTKESSIINEQRPIEANPASVVTTNVDNSNTTKNNLAVKFKQEDKVKHIEEGILGTVKFVGKDKVAVVWEDGSRERFAISELDQLAYVNDIETQVSPLTNQMGGTEPLVKKINDDIPMDNIRKIDKPKLEIRPEMDDLFSKALSEMEDGYDDIEDANPNKLTNQMLERKVNSLEKKLEDNKIENIKNKAIEEIISLMKTKGMIKDSSAEESQRQLIFAMDDTAFESYRQAILGTPSNRSKVEKTDAEKALESIRNGTFKSSNPGTLVDMNDSDNGDSDARDLQSIRSASKNDNGLNLENFKNIQGLKTPVYVEDRQVSPLTNMKDAILGLNWTVLSKS